MAMNVTGLDAGVYHYRPKTHELDLVAAGDRRKQTVDAARGQQSIAQAPVVFVFTAVQSRTAGKYGARAERYVAIEAGAAAENLALEAVALNLGTCFVGAFEDAATSALLGLGEGEAPIIMLPADAHRSATRKRSGRALPGVVRPIWRLRSTMAANERARTRSGDPALATLIVMGLILALSAKGHFLTNMSEDERRQFKRVRLLQPIRGSVGRRVIYVFDGSAGGLCILHRGALPAPGHSCKIVLPMGPRHDQRRMRGRSHGIADRQRPQRASFRSGVRIVSADEQSLSLLRTCFPQLLT